MTNVRDCLEKYPISSSKNYGLKIEFRGADKQFGESGQFWEVAAKAAIHFANYKRQQSRLAQIFQSFWNIEPKFTLCEIGSGDEQTEPEPFTDIDLQMAIDAAEHTIPDALWAMMATGMISQDKVNTLTRRPDILEFSKLEERVSISR